jgi:N-acetylneuraminic acid mutarotase
MSVRALRVAAAFVAAVLLLAGACTNEAPPPSTATLSPSGTASTAPLSGVWRRIPSPPGGARQEVAAAALGAKIYVAGGLLANGGATTRVEAYDPSTRSWSQVAPLPIGIHHPMAVGFRDRLYVIGGIDPALGAETARVFVLDGDRWSEAPSMHHARGAGSAVVVGDRIVVAGGISGGQEVAPVEIFDGKAWRDGARMPSPLDHVGAATDGRYVFVAGGRRSGSHFGSFQRYDPAADSWQRLKSMPTARSGLGVAFASGHVFAIGGEGPRIFPEVEAFDVSSGTWRRLPDMGVPRHGLGTVAIGTTVYTFVGGAKVGLDSSSVCEALVLS